MKATYALKKEHEAVRLMMKIMDAACVKINAQQKLQTADIYDMIDFLKVFVDRAIMAKRNKSCFPSWSWRECRRKAVQSALCLPNMNREGFTSEI